MNKKKEAEGWKEENPRRSKEQEITIKCICKKIQEENISKKYLSKWIMFPFCITKYITNSR